MKLKLGSLATYLGLLALCTFILYKVFGPVEKKPNIQEVVVEKSKSVKQWFDEKIIGKEIEESKPERKFGPDKMIKIFIVSTSLAAFALGVLAFIRKEKDRAAVLAITLAMATLFNYLSLFTFIALLVIMVVGLLLAQSLENKKEELEV